MDGQIWVLVWESLGSGVSKTSEHDSCRQDYRRGEYWVIDGNLGCITTDGVEKPVKDREE